MTAPLLSLVIPAFDEERRIGASLKIVGEFLAGLGRATEVVVVDDGSREPGRLAVEAAVDALPGDIQRQLVRHEVNRGKGAAVRTGCLAARGHIVAFIDADLATPPEEVLRLVRAIEDGADVAVGVRRQADGSDMRSRRGPVRRLAGMGFAFFMRTLLLPGVSDSQCPLKAFERGAAQRLFRLQKTDSWSFDAEVLFLASRLGLNVVQIPVRWQAVPGSHLRLGLSSLRELWNLLRVRWAHRGVSPKTLAGEAPEPA